jgi:NAD(P)-dependent dehydrogenase (short-subunit alcohol dehydrogenase family)
MDLPAVVITGVSTGIGFASAHLLAKGGFHVFGSVRRPQDADVLRQELGDRFTPLLFDLRDDAAISSAAAVVRDALKGNRLLGLVNNAGMGLGGPLALQPIEEIKLVFEVNVIGTIAVTQAFTPLLGADRSLKGPPGRIVNISSIGGKVGFPLMGAYAGSKFALEGMSESLRRELLVYGIDVIVIAPHSANTPLLDKAEAQAQDITRYEATPYVETIRRVVNFIVVEGRAGFAPEHIAKFVKKALTAPKPKARYSVVPKPFEAWLLTRVLSVRMVDRLLAKQFALVQGSNGGREAS